MHIVEQYLAVCKQEFYGYNVLLFFREESKEKEEIGAENFAVLERIRVNQREEHLRVWLL